MSKEKDPMDETSRIQLKAPFEILLSDSIKGKFGFKDAHVELEVRIVKGAMGKLVKPFRQSFTIDEVRILKDALDKAIAWSNRPEAERQAEGV